MKHPEPTPQGERRTALVAFILILIMLALLAYGPISKALGSTVPKSTAVPTVVVPTAAAPAATPPFRRCPRTTIAYRAHGDPSHMTACRSIAPATPTPNR
jgi:hypothetical protein